VLNAGLTLHEAADQLGVHYMTVYRYVRLGLLHAEKHGGVWRVDHADLEAFAAAPSGSSGGRRRAPWAERLESRLMAGDAGGAWGVVEAALASGAELDEIYLEVLSPALVSIGERWQRGEIDIAVEHRATGIAMRLIGRLGPRFVRRGRARGAVVLGAPAGETHALPVAIVADLLRFEGWDVSDLGADTPASSFAHTAATTDDVVAVGVSVTNRDNLDSVGEVCAAVAKAAPSVLVVVGGGALADANQAAMFGAHAVARSAEHFARLLDEHVGP
jgi:MerR family transcriptional regulator, light-induced transcriptional regulator